MDKENYYNITIHFSALETQAKAVEEFLRVNAIPEIVEGVGIDKYLWQINLYKQTR